jgi:hypothetical protein
MRESQHRFVGLACIVLLGSATFAACGSLDPRKVTRGPEFSAAGGEDGEAGNGPGPGPGPNAGGSSSMGGEMGNPFGGQLFIGGAPPVLDGPPEVEEVDPVDMATDVDVDGEVSLLFTEAMDPATVTETSVQLLSGGEPVSGSVSLDEMNGLVATIDPTRRLALAASYEVNVSTDVTDTTGTALEEAFTSSFTTRDGAWEVTNSSFVADPATNWYMYNEAFLAVDGRGNALVAWQQPDATLSNQAVWARWHRATTGWQDAVQLSSGMNYASYARIAANESGDAVAVWYEYNEALAKYDILARRFVNGAWSAAPEPVQGDLMMANMYTGPFVQMRGDRVLVWWTYSYQSGTNYYDYLYAQSATVTGAWPTTPQYVGSVSSTENIGQSALAMDSAGNGMLVYQLGSSSANALHFAKYVAATDAWEPPAPVPNATNVLYDTPAVALDESGAAMVAWRNGTGNYDLVASRYTKARGFAMPATLDDLDTQPQVSYSNPIATDGTNFFVTWSQDVGATANAYGARYSTADGAWSPATLLSDGDTGLGQPPSMVADAQGNAMSIWLQGDAIYENMMYDYSAVQFKYARFQASEAAWQGPAVMVGNKNYDRYHGHSSAVGANGMIAVLSYFEGDYNTSTPAEPWLHVFR